MGEDPLPMWAVNKHASLRKLVQCHLPQWACSSSLHKENSSKQSLRGQVSVKLTPEICINKASNNSRLTAVGRQATASNSHSQNRLHTLFFFFLFSLPTFHETTTKLWLHAEKLTETVLHLNLGHFVGFLLLLLFCVVLVYFIFPLWWDNYRTTSEAPSPELEAEGWRPKLLRLKLYCIWT
jgi:hypothetical protein